MLKINALVLFRLIYGDSCAVKPLLNQIDKQTIKLSYN